MSETDQERGQRVTGAARSARRLVSVIVPAHDAESLLVETLPLLIAESVEDCDLEVIVVDDDSTDGTAALAESLGARVVRMPENRGPSRARNAGARQARGDYLVFIDADVGIHPGVISRAVAFLDGRPDIAAVFGSYDSRPRERGLLTEYKNLLHHFVHQNGKREAATFWTGCGAIRRRVFDSVGGFDEEAYPRCIEDIELGYRLRGAGHRILLDRSLQCTHLKRWTLVDWLRTDIFCRAIPWASLNLQRGVAPNDLNISKGQQISVLLAGSAVAMAVLAPIEGWFLLGSGLAVAGSLGLNHRFFEFLRRERGWWFSLRCLPLHLLYFLYSGGSYAYAWLMHRLGIRPFDGNTCRH
jgi:glycosyltransferase involved in cell wall biosynthesis